MPHWKDTDAYNKWAAGCRAFGKALWDVLGERRKFVAACTRKGPDGPRIKHDSRYALEPLKRDGLVLGYGGLTPRRIAAGTERLARAIERASRGDS